MQLKQTATILRNILSVVIVMIALASCGTQKTLSGGGLTSATEASSLTQQKQAFVRRVAANAATTRNIVSKIDFSIDAFGQDISVDGKIYMRKDEVIRIVLSPLGLMEVGRLEFTPEYVLIIDRMHKQYVKATYSDLDFLKNNGLDFYTLQSLFWNELFIPGQKKLSDNDLSRFDAEILKSATDRTVTFNSGRLSYEWKATALDALISDAKVTYDEGKATSSQATWQYADFTDVAGKKFPRSQVLSFASSLMPDKKMQMKIKMGRPSTESGWDAQTTVSSKYEQVKAEDILRKLVNM